MMKIPLCSLVLVKKKSGFLPPPPTPPRIPSGVYGQGGLLMGREREVEALRGGQKCWEENSEALPQPISICYPSGVALQGIRLCGSLTFKAGMSLR